VNGGRREGLAVFGVGRRLLARRLLEMLEEDIGFGDVTTWALVPEGMMARGRVVAREPGVAAGVGVGAVLLEELGVRVERRLEEGVKFQTGECLLEGVGEAAVLLSAERTLLNLMGRMCGVATVTAQMVEAARRVNPKVRVAATRKTAPLLRLFDKMAVAAGGGDPHRWGLDDAVLIKDNHLAVLGWGVARAVEEARRWVSFTCPVEVEVNSMEEAVEAARAGADAILLDNMTFDQVSMTVEAVRQLGLPRTPVLEASGNITPSNVEEYASTGVDVLSAGLLTHSAPSLDLTFIITPLGPSHMPNGNHSYDDGEDSKGSPKR